MWTLSVCIPVYNSDVRSLVATLCAQIEQSKLNQINIVLLDDASEDQYKPLLNFNHQAVQCHLLTQNIGRSKIRNAFLKYTTSTHLLFIDGDSCVKNSDFLLAYKHYLDQNPNCKVLVGASCYDQYSPPTNQRLRWKYSSKRESLTFDERKRDTQHGFKTNNFVIARELLIENPFDERLNGYGHEDTLFGFQLFKKGIQIDQIDNPVWNLNLDTNEIFLMKTDEALRNLLWISINFELLGFETASHLLRTYKRLKTFGITRLILRMLYWKSPLLKSLLQTGKAPLFIFDFYRLGRLWYLDKNTQNKIS